MALETTTQIFISGTPIRSYKSIKLNQEISSHHDLTLVCRADVVEGLSDDMIGESKDHLGATITVRVSPALNIGSYRELEFKGIIIKVEGAKGSEYGKSDMVIFHAKSTSILSDDGAHYASFTDVGLAEILEDTFSEYDRGKLETRFSPTSSDTVHYAVQHNQSAFDFAGRLAAYYNQWFYYDGSKLVFGTPGDEETELSYGTDLQNFSVELSSVPNAFKYFTNDYLTNELHQKGSNEVTIPSEGYHGFTNQKSQEVFTKQTQVYHNLYTDENVQARLDQQAEAYTKAKALKQVIAKGESDNPGVNLGEVISVQGYGRYRVTKVSHTNTEGGIYKNTFEAVAADFTVYPNMDLHRFPKSEIQIATVVENNDPEGLSRIKVQFPWQQESGQTTPWLRMMTPHAGADKGFHFIPEIGEEVVVNFENGNAERPFVAGALYHGTANASGWQSDANNIKAIKTRTGHTVELNDTEGEESITITDKNSNIIRIDTVNNSIEVSASEHITFNAKNIEINASEEVKINAGTNLIGRATEDLSLNAKNSTETIEENKTLVAKEVLENAEKVRIESSKENMELVSSKQVDVQANDKIKLF
ncbi:type VI secretion system Vgr family protein [Aquimarina algicola]|uniref:Gp5/Type VI secretion system Vgr protein OB-fold domain-containing protein n=1 Tax=Aquimarina algicola TaxID=2589995 RepID=A0A504IWW3_9FLAO|nr:phage baseplate assembly protein V [Aquimarina algicola]TPN82967.1 hypothetical protein FHK87_21310 [Aquimarina algicola]